METTRHFRAQVQERPGAYPDGAGRPPLHSSIRRERYDGETVLLDLRPGGADDATLRVIVRYAALRFVVRAQRGLSPEQLEEERRVALEYVARARELSSQAEAEALLALVVEAGGASPAVQCRRLRRVARAARRAGERHGAIACMRLAFEVGWRGGAADAARGAARWLARAAAEDGAAEAARLWRRAARAQD